MNRDDRRRSSRAIIGGLAVALALGAAGADAHGQAFAKRTVELTFVPAETHWLDVDGDGTRELLAANQSVLELHAPLAGETKRRQVIAKRQGFLYDLRDLDGDRRLELVVIGARGVEIHRLEKGRFVSPAKPALRIRRRYGPSRPMRVRMLEDVNGDGAIDLIYPAGARYRLFFGDGQGGFRASGSHALPSGMRVTVRAAADALDAQIESSFHIPRLIVRDVDGDGRPDLIAQLARRLDIYRGRAEGAAFDESPAWVLDLARFDAKPERSSGGRLRVSVDAVNLSQEDLDGDGVRDFLVASGRKVWLFFAGEGFQGFDRPDRILQVSDDIAAIFTGDVDQDGRYDLVLVKFEMPGMTRLVAALLVGIELRIEALAYRNRGDRTISTKPDRVNRISFDVPPILSLLSNIGELEARAGEARENARRLRVGDFNGDGIPDVGIRSKDGRRLSLFACRGKGGVAGGIASREMMDRVIRDLLFDRDRREWDLDRLMEYMGDLRYSLNRDQIEGQRPKHVFELRTGQGRTDFAFENLNADDKADVVVSYDTFRGRALDLYLSKDE